MNTPSHPIETPEARRTPLSVAGDLWAATRTFRPVLFLLIVVSVVLSITQEGFMTTVNLQNIATSVAVLWLVALGATFVQLSGGIDLSSGAIAGIAGICLTKLLGTAVPEPLVIVLVVLFGAALGAAINGVLVGIFNLNVFVVTLASMTAITGAISLWSGTQSTYVFSDTVSFLAVDKFLALPMPVWIMAVAFLAFLFLQTRTYFGRDIYAIGGSMTAARLSGIRTARTLIVVWGVAGGMAALAGIIAVGRIGASAPQPDNTLPLSAIAAILLGGTALSGGMGGVGGTVLGVLFIGVLQNGLSLSGAPTYWQQIVTGFILVAAVMGDRIQSHSAWVKLRDRRKRGPVGGAALGGTSSPHDTGSAASLSDAPVRHQVDLPAMNGSVRT
jgi:ribose transport system permease protein